jgi:isoaspartyl peptidase/L-asparaginase-like protein (Ntn-hydrolase superfamily)
MVSVYDIFKRSTINGKIFVLTLGMNAQNAVEESLRFMNSRVKGAGGAICISASGEAAFHFTTERMAWAIAKADVLSWGLDPNERNTEIMA